MKKLLIVGKKSFIAKNIYFYLKQKFFLHKISFYEFQKFKKKNLLSFDYIINCSISKEYVSKHYSAKKDFDFQIAKKIYKTPIKMIFLSSRKVYKCGDNIRENDYLEPSCFYSKNKLITENKLKILLSDKILILRISNIIARPNLKKYYRKIHYTFIDNFFLFIKKNIIFDNGNVYKDFLSIDKFSEILLKLINTNATGTYNVSIGKKIYIEELIKWLNFYNISKNIKKITIPNDFNKDSFYLNNSKLKKKIKIKISKMELKKYCINLSKYYFRIN